MVKDLEDPRRNEPELVLGERQMLEAWLEFHRTTRPGGTNVTRVVNQPRPASLMTPDRRAASRARCAGSTFT